MLARRPLGFACSCSRDRVAAMLQALGEEEARGAVQGHGEAEVRCEFCGRSYVFAASQIEELFSRKVVEVPGPDSLQ